MYALPFCPFHVPCPLPFTSVAVILFLICCGRSFMFVAADVVPAHGAVPTALSGVFTCCCGGRVVRGWKGDDGSGRVVRDGGDGDGDGK